MDATTSSGASSSLPLHLIVDDTLALVSPLQQSFQRSQRHCFGDSAPGDFPLAANPSIVLHVLTSCNLEAEDLAHLEATCTFFRKPANFPPDFQLSMSELAALDMCQKRAIFKPMTAQERELFKQHCGGSWKLVLRFIMAGEVCCRREKCQAIAGPGHSIAVTSSGAVYTFGSNNSGQLGHGSLEEEWRPRIIRSLQGIRIIQAAAGAGRTMLVSDAGRVYAFGKDSFGEVEYGVQGSRFVTTPQMVESLKGIYVVQAAIGNFFTAVLSREGRVYTFSWGKDMKLGHQTEQNDVLPHLLTGPLENIPVVQIAAGYCYLLALACQPSGMSVYSVGCGLGGKLGHGARTDEKYPRLIEQFKTLSIQPVVVAAGAWHAAVVGKDGRVCTWGWGRYGCLGHGNEECESVPKVVQALGSVKAVHVATGDYTTFVVSDKGDVYSFGCGESSSLGHSTITEPIHSSEREEGTVSSLSPTSTPPMEPAGVSRRSPAIRLLCPKKSIFYPTCPLIWLVGSPRFLPPLTVVAALRCVYIDPSYADLPQEADELRGLLLRGFDIVGAVRVWGATGGFFHESAVRALEQARALRKLLFGEGTSHGMIGGCGDADTNEIRFLVSESDGQEAVEPPEVVWEDEPGRLLWDKGCLLRCELPLKLPFYIPSDQTSGIEASFSSLIESTVAKLRDPNVCYLVEGPLTTHDESHHSIILHGSDINYVSHQPQNPITKESSAKNLSCSEFFPTDRCKFSLTRDAIQITILSNQSADSSKARTPVVKYFPAPASASLRVINLKLDILCYASIDFPVAAAVSELVVPGLNDQLSIMMKAIASELLSQQPQLCPYHFLLPGLPIPLTAIYDTRYGEIEEKQSELRRNLHSRFGLPLDRPIFRISNALTFGGMGRRDKSSSKNGSSLLRDVHREIPSSVSGGTMSLIDGSYEYYHYLHDGIDDNGWGCAYRSLQTIVSWYRLQQYSSINVPSHREIQQVLVEIGDKDPSFIGSREWIGAIELSFVLDKLLGVSCKIINVRSGDELPEKCRELAMHFETQGTPVMIGGGVLAYTLLGVDYNESTGDCAFLILDPHYTGSDDLKKIVNGGWCGWKKSVDSKGRSFFLKDKFYNLLLPQRPNMV